jgi:twitching motility protein PilT
VAPTVAVDDLLRHLVERGGSDLHLKAGAPPVVRVDGVLHRTEHPPLAPQDTEQAALHLMDERVAGEFAETGEADFAYTLPGLGRFRCNAYRQRGAVGLAVRSVLDGSASFGSLGLPPIVEKLADEPRGLLLVTGMTGSGKTTTTGAIVHHINSTRSVHVMTIEDPIEILHADRMAVVNQREVGIDTKDFAHALRSVLRQDPDVIFIGEMRDHETVQTALMAAETGHLVISTLHTIDAAETVNRVIEFYPPHQQTQARATLAGSLRGILSQRLLPRADGPGRIPAVEILVMTGRVRDLIMNPDQTHLIPQVVSEGDYYGMQTFDQSLLRLFREGRIRLDDALAAASSSHDFHLMVRQAGLVPS